MDGCCYPKPCQGTVHPDGNPRLVAKAKPKSSLQQQGGFPILELD
jgi:hypothetical protein